MIQLEGKNAAPVPAAVEIVFDEEPLTSKDAFKTSKLATYFKHSASDVHLTVNITLPPVLLRLSGDSSRTIINCVESC